MLGPVQARVSGRRIPLDGSITESLLAALVIDADRIVTLDALVDVGWELDPPRTVRRQIRNRLARLRRALVDGGFPPGVIGVEGNGYVLDTSGCARSPSWPTSCATPATGSTHCPQTTLPSPTCEPCSRGPTWL